MHQHPAVICCRVRNGTVTVHDLCLIGVQSDVPIENEVAGLILIIPLSSCLAEVSISHTTLSVRLVQLLGSSLTDLRSVEHFCNGHASFWPARVADLLRHWIVPCLLLASDPQ